MDDLTPIPGSIDRASGAGELSDPFSSGEITDVARRARARRRTARQSAAALERGEIVGGRYRILRIIGCGAMSDVYLAEQQGIGRLVALKLVHRDSRDDYPSVVRFQREARMLARVDHPNVVTVYDIGETRDGDPYMAMEYVPGRTLGQLIRKHGRFDPIRTVSLLLQVSRAIAAVHQVGVIHRDLKPDNVLVVRTRSGVEMAKVADFGLAKAFSTERDDHITQLTKDGAVIGTPEFMSPEQVKGGPIDPRADIYSMGCMAYEMLTGSPPFVGAELSTLYSQMHDPPAPLREACPAADLAAFQGFIDRVLAKDPDKRYPNVLHMYSALLRASDRAGIPRRDLRLVQSLFDDPAYAKTHDRDNVPAPQIARVAPARPGKEKLLLCCIVATVVLTIGVALGRLVG